MAKPELEYSTISIHIYSVGWNQASSPMLRPTELGAFILRIDGYQDLEASFFLSTVHMRATWQFVEASCGSSLSTSTTMLDYKGNSRMQWEIYGAPTCPDTDSAH